MVSVELKRYHEFKDSQSSVAHTQTDTHAYYQNAANIPGSTQPYNQREPPPYQDIPIYIVQPPPPYPQHSQYPKY